MWTAFAATFLAVLAAEVVGDKLLYTTGVLATTYRWSGMLPGIALAFALKMAVAVAAGDAIARLVPRWCVAATTAASFAAAAAALLREPADAKPRQPGRGVLVSFGTVFFSEWGDLGMITAGALAARYTAAGAVWAGAVAAMLAKGTVALALGAALRRWAAPRFAPRAVRRAGALALAVVGTMAVLEVAGVLT